MSAPRITISLVNPQSAGTGPFDHAAIVADALAKVPAGLRKRVAYWNPGRANYSVVPAAPGEKMPYPTNVPGWSWDEACDVVEAQGGTLLCYGGVRRSGDNTPSGIAAALFPFRRVGGANFWFDNADGEDNVPGDGYSLSGPEVSAIRAWIGKGHKYTVGLESNMKRQWILDLIAKYPGRVEIAAESWLWAASEPGGLNGWHMRNRFTFQSCLDAGAIPVTLIARRVKGNDGEAPDHGWIDVSPAQWPAFKAELCEKAVLAGGRACLRPVGMNADLLAKVEKLNAA